MSYSFNQLKAEAFSLLNAMPATTSTVLETNYQLAGSGIVNSLSTDWAQAQVEDAILDAEYQICVQIAMADRHPERADFEETSNLITSGSILPITATSGKYFVGDYSAIIDSVTGVALQERPLALVRMAVLNEQSIFPISLHVYAIAGARIYFKAPNPVRISGPAINRATWVGNIRCRDSHALAIVSGAMSFLLTKEGAWPEAWQMHSQIWATHMAQIQGVERQTAVPLPSQT
jgi:hypothetical protein